jgi:hypothetical protein
MLFAACFRLKKPSFCWGFCCFFRYRQQSGQCGNVTSMARSGVLSVFWCWCVTFSLTLRLGVCYAIGYASPPEKNQSLLCTCLGV